MQIGKNAFLDIRVKESNKRNLINYENLKIFQFRLTAGASLPWVIFSFYTTDQEVADLFIQNNKIEVTFGVTEEEADTYVVSTFARCKDTDKSGSAWTIIVAGFIGDAPSYMISEYVCESYNGNSLMVVEQVLKKYFGENNAVETDIEKTNENQVTWRQTYETSSSFVVSTLLHMDIRPSFPLFTFDRKGKFYVRDFKKLQEAGYQWKFTPYPNISSSNEIQYLNNFNIENYKSTYNLYSGYNKLAEIPKISKGIPEHILVDNKIPTLASSEETEINQSGNRVSLNRIQSDNVHNTYEEAFVFNTDKLVSLSSMLGTLVLRGYYPELKPTDLVYIETDKKMGSDSTLEGLYLIDSIVIAPDIRRGRVLTYVYVTRDNENNVENYITQKPQGVNVTKKFLQDLVNAVSEARVAMATCAQIMDGTFLGYVGYFLTATKVNLLRMFSISGIALDFTAQARLIQTLLCSGNAIMNALISMLFPDFIATTLRDFLLNKPTSKTLLNKYITDYVPFEVQGIVSSLVDSLYKVNSSLNSIAEENGITVREIPAVPKENSSYNEPENKIAGIIQEFENNTTGLDIPFPIITLSESQALMPYEEIKDLVASETISNLEELGYMDGVDTEEFKEILLGETPIDFEIINQINRNAGYRYNYRFWGTYGPSNQALYAWTCEYGTIYTKQQELNDYTRLYNEEYAPYVGDNFIVDKVDGVYLIKYVTENEESVIAERDESKDIISNALAQLTNYYITKGFKDAYRTIPCTKLISATGNARLYFACPQSEENLKFYINSRRVELESFPIDLGYEDVYGEKVMYNVYYTTSGFNSNSTMLEVRQG